MMINGMVGILESVALTIRYIIHNAKENHRLTCIWTWNDFTNL